MYSTEEKDLMKSRILEEMTGSECRSLDDILLNDVLGEFPAKSTVYGWLQSSHNQFDQKFTDDYERARDIRADHLFEKMINIANTPVLGETVKSGLLGDETTTGDMIQHRRLQVDTHKWVLSRMKPKKYGDKIETTITGGDKPVQTVDYSKLSPEVLEELAKQADANKPKS
jgi:hypothetical protein